MSDVSSPQTHSPNGEAPLQRTSAALWQQVAALVAVSWFFYVLQLAPGAIGGDNTQMLTIARLGGLAHPPGYPLTTWLLRLGGAVPGLSAATAGALVMSVVGALTVGATAAAAYAWGASRRASLWVAAMFGAAPIVLHLATHAEVFAPNAMLCAFILAMSGPRASCRGAARLMTLGLLAGLALSNHHSAVLLAPAGLYGVWLGWRELDATPLARRVAWLLGAAAALLGTMALLYGSLLWIAQQPELGVRWGQWRDLQGLIDHFLRREFGTLSLSSRKADPDPTGHVALLGWTLLTSSLAAAPLLTLAALRDLLPATPRGDAGVPSTDDSAPTRSEADGDDRASWATGEARRVIEVVVLGLTVALTGPAFVSLFNLPTEGWGVVVVERFHQLPLLALWIFAARGVDVALPWLEQRLPQARRGALVGLIGAALAVGLGVRAADMVRAWHTPVLEQYLTNTLQAAPKNSVLLGTGEHRLFGFNYAQKVLGVRPDVVYIDPSLLTKAWYRAQVSARLGKTLAAPPDNSVNTVALAVGLQQLGRPVLLTNLFNQKIVQSQPTYPLGTCVAIHSGDAPPPPPGALAERNRALYAEFKLEGLGQTLDLWSHTAAQKYAKTWLTLAQALEGAGDAEGARAARALADKLTPPPAQPSL